MRCLVAALLSVGALVQGCGGDPCAAGASVLTGQLHPECSSGGAASGGASAPALASGSGNGSITVPDGLTAVRVTATTTATADNFVVRIAGRLTVNEVLDTQTPGFTGTYSVTPGSSITVSAAPVTRWSVDGSSPATSSGGLFAASGAGDQVFSLPDRSTAYRIQAQYSGTAQNFIVRVDGRLLVNVILGSAEGATSYSTTVRLSGGTVSIVSSTGVSWTMTETPP